MAENTNQTPDAAAGYAAEGRELEVDSLAATYPVDQTVADDEARGFALQEQVLSAGEPARVVEEPKTAAAGDASEMLGEVLQSQELNPDEPAVTNDPVPLEGAAPAVAAGAAAGYVADGRAIEQEAVATAYPGQPVATAANPAAAQAAYQATYGAPAATGAAPQPAAQPTAGRPTGPGAAPAYNPRAAVQAAAAKKPSEPLDPERVFIICGMVVGAIVIVFGLCMLAYYTPDDVSSLFDTYQMNGSAGFASAGATSAQVLKAGFSMLLIGLGATDICAFGAKYMKAKKREQK